MIQARAVVIGAGLAGAATAYHLARRGVAPLVILEKERAAGMHASGRNAAMVRQIVPRAPIAQMAREGARAIAQLALEGSSAVGFRARGSLLLARDARLETLAQEAAVGREAGLSVSPWSHERAVDRVSALRRGDFQGAWFCPTDGVVDVAQLLSYYLKGAEEAGASLALGKAMAEVLVENGRTAGVQAGDLRIRAPIVVNAAGAWAGDVAARAGAAPIRMRAMRRHLFHSGPCGVPSDWPFVWDLSHEIYFRPESGGLLLSPCDESEHAPELLNEVPSEDPAALELLEQKLIAHLPTLCDLPIARGWAGLRTFADDSSFVIGPDPVLPGFFWAAGLGGHGVTTSHAVGRLAAELVEQPERDAGNPFSPRRLVARS